MELKDASLKEKELLSKAFETFNKSIQKLRQYQSKLETQVQELHNELGLKNQELTNILESLPNGLIVTDLNGNILTFNRAAISITSISKEEAQGKNINKLLRCSILPSNLDSKGLQQVQDSKPTQFQFEREDGSKLILNANTTLMKSDDGEDLGIIINLNDITKIKKLEEEAERKNRLTTMGEIAANVAHEIRNPLGSIELFVSILKMDLKDDEEKMDLISHIFSGVRSMNHLISNLLEYAKPRPIIKKDIPTSELLDRFLAFTQHSATQTEVEVYQDLEVEDDIVYGDEELIKQVLHNIFANALQSMPEGGKLSVSLSNSVENDPDLLKRFNPSSIKKNKPVALLNIRFQDTGKGMSEEVRRRLFDPFYTTKERGTGLGMSITQNIIDSHGGAISVESEIDKGSTITLHFPLKDQDTDGK